MGFVCIVEFVLTCFYVVPWTLFALVYPLCASIRAIETDSRSDFRKLVAYWVLFSLTFLFEDAFVKLLEWLPSLWPYIKLIIFGWLVLSNFDGALYIYQHLLHPCISLDFKELINQFKERRELFFNRINIVAEAKRYVKENGHKTLEGILTSKSKSRERINDVQKDMKAVEVKETKEVVAAKQVSQTEPSLTQTENKKFEPEDIKGISATVAAGSEVSGTPISSKVQQESTCGVCQLRAPSEANLKLHLEATRHKSCEEQLKAKNQASKNKVSPTSEDKKSEDSEPPKQKPLQVQQDNVKNKCVELKDSMWCCTLCNVSCPTMEIMLSHLNGKKHLARIRQSNAVVDGSVHGS